MNFPKRTGNQRGERRPEAEQRSKKLPENLAWTPRWADVAFDACRARVAELADAVDSKSTDESLVGSTPTPGTSFSEVQRFAALRCMFPA
jgi:hypothetical protein